MRCKSTPAFVPPLPLPCSLASAVHRQWDRATQVPLRRGLSVPDILDGFSSVPTAPSHQSAQAVTSTCSRKPLACPYVTDRLSGRSSFQEQSGFPWLYPIHSTYARHEVSPQA